MHWLSWTLAMALAGGQPTPTSRPPSEPSMKRKTAYGMLFGGGAATLGMMWVGGMVAATYRDSDDWIDRDAGKVLAYPLAGPFIAARRVRLSTQERAAFATIGVQQWIGLAITMAGGIGVSEHRKYDRYHGKRWEPSSSVTTAMVAGGMAGFVLTYGLTAGFSNDARRRGDAFGSRMSIPLVGGFMAAAYAPNHRLGALGLTSSALQVAGVGIAGAGIGLSVRRQRRRHNVAVMPSVGPDHAFVTTTVRF